MTLTEGSRHFDFPHSESLPHERRPGDHFRSLVKRDFRSTTAVKFLTIAGPHYRAILYVATIQARGTRIIPGRPDRHAYTHRHGHDAAE